MITTFSIIDEEKKPKQPKETEIDLNKTTLGQQKEIGLLSIASVMEHMNL